eukprot:6194188-Pleurochrysis_carterae.AAC.9
MARCVHTCPGHRERAALNDTTPTTQPSLPRVSVECCPLLGLPKVMKAGMIGPKSKVETLRLNAQLRIIVQSENQTLRLSHCATYRFTLTLQSLWTH